MPLFLLQIQSYHSCTDHLATIAARLNFKQIKSSSKTAAMAAAAANLSEVMEDQVGKSDEDVETVALKATVTSESSANPHSLDDICKPSKSFRFSW